MYYGNGNKIIISNDTSTVTFLGAIFLLSTNRFPKPGFPLTRFTPVLHFIQKPVIWFALKIEWLVSIWNATLGWNGLRSLISQNIVKIFIC